MWWPTKPINAFERRLLRNGGCFLAILVFVVYLWVDRGVAMSVEYCTWRHHLAWNWFTKIGEAAWWLAVTVALAVGSFAVGRRSLGMSLVLIFTSVAGAGILVNVLKIIFARPRPSLMFDQENPLYGFQFCSFGCDLNSFPSGHASTIAAVCGAACILVPRLALLWVAVAVPIVTARVIVGAHFVSDVMAGFYVGIFASIITSWWLRNHCGVPWAVAGNCSVEP